MSASVPITQPRGAAPAAPRHAATAARAESRLRIVATSVIMYLMAQGLYGSTWDIQWHAAVGAFPAPVGSGLMEARRLAACGANGGGS